MLKKVLATLAAVGVMVPVLAYSWSLSSTVSTSGGKLQVRTAAPQTSVGSVFSSYTTHANVPVFVTANPGYIISTVKVNGTIQTPPPGTVQMGLSAFPTKTAQSISASFDKQLVPVTFNGGPGGTVSPGGVLNLQAGSVKTYTLTPNAGNSVQAITGSGLTFTLQDATTLATVTLPYAGAVKLSLTVPASAATLTAAFQTVVAKAGAPQTVMTGSTVTLDGSATTGATTYTWTKTSGPAVTLNLANPAKPTFPGAVAGVYNFTLVASDGTSSSTAYTNVTVTSSPAAAAAAQCVNCHVSSGVGVAQNVYSNWSSSAHKANVVMCATCHVGADTGGHPGVAVTAATCESCHTATLSTTTHPVAITASKCLDCHNSHDPAQGIADLTPSNHPAVTLYTFEEVGMQMAGGAKVPVQVDANGKGMPYSPKQTCGTSGCHIKNGVDYTYDKISDHAFHSAQGRNEYVDSANGKLDATKNKPWYQSTAMVGKW